MRKRKNKQDKDQPNLKRIRAEVENLASAKEFGSESGFSSGKSSGNPKHNRKEKRKEARNLKKVRKLAYSQRKPIPTQEDVKKERREANNKKQKEVKLKRLDSIKKDKQKRTAKRKQQVKEEEEYQSRVQDTYDDREIRDLEKKLKLNKRKKDTLPQAFIDDGLDYIFDVIGGKKVNEQEMGENSEESESDAEIGIKMGTESDDEDGMGGVAGDADDDGDDGDDNAVPAESSDNASEDSGSEDDQEGRKLTKQTAKPSKAANTSVKWKDKLIETEDNKISQRKDDSSNKHRQSVTKPQRKGYEDSDSDQNPDDSDLIASDPDSADDIHIGEDIDTPDDNSSENNESDENADSADNEHKNLGDNKEYSEDIYGRLRDDEGNVVNPSTTVGGGTYVPPGKRKLMEGLDGKKKLELERLKKQLKGLVNRASESNIQPISSQIENLYLTNSRADVNDSLKDLVFDACITASLTPERLAMEIMMLLAILHGNIGSEVGAAFLQNLVQKFDELSRLPEYGVGKHMDNVVVLLAHLYNFKVIHSVLLFDVIKRLVTSFKEKDIELILLILRHAGFTLRKDDPTELKAIILDIQSKATGEKASALADQSRVKFMLDVIMAIRNNNMRKIPNYDPEHLDHLRKLIRNYIRGGQFGDNQLHISLEDLLHAGDKGRWWVVGSAWEGQGPKQQQKGVTDELTSVIRGVEISSRLQELARKQRMNTDLRRNIFYIIMTSEDFIDAFEKLLHQGLKSQQQQEIILVTMDCCLHEKTYNPFYSHLGQKFCEHHRSYQMAFQFCLWDKFKEVGQLTDASRQNLGKMITHLLATKALSLSVLKVISFGTLEKPMVRLLKQVLSDLLLAYPQSTTEVVFQRIAMLDKLKMLHEGLKLFLQHFLLRGKTMQQNPLLKERVEIVNRILSSGKNKMLL